MKTLVRVLITIAVIPVAVVTVIKFVRKCSWKEAVGITEELWIEIKNACTCCREETEDVSETA